MNESTKTTLSLSLSKLKKKFCRSKVISEISFLSFVFFYIERFIRTHTHSFSFSVQNLDVKLLVAVIFGVAAVA